MFDILSPSLILFALAVTAVGGVVKGAVGFALPLVMVSGLGILIDPTIVMGMIIIPLLFSNLWQALRKGVGAAGEAVRLHWRFVVAVMVMIFLAAQFFVVIPVAVLFVLLGVTVVTLCGIQIAGWRPKVAPQNRNQFEVFAGIGAGTLGGLAGTWGPPTVLYLMALDTPKARQMAVQGVIYGLGSVMLLLGHLRSGVMNADVLPTSILLVIPALIGQWIGFRINDRIDQDRFRRMTLWVLVIAGLNLIRRGFTL